MTTPSAAQSQQQLTTTEVAALLATGATVAVLSPAVVTSLVAVGVSAAAARAALTLVGATSVLSVLPIGPASRATATSEQFFRAAYLVAAGQRIQADLDSGMSMRAALGAERPNLSAHLGAKANRKRAAAAVDAQTASHGYTLGWKAQMDERTSAECRRANGRNFSALSRPLIGWPGTVHPHCRCAPVAPFVGAGFVDDVVTQTERREAVA